MGSAALVRFIMLLLRICLKVVAVMLMLLMAPFRVRRRRTIAVVPAGRRKGASKIRVNVQLQTSYPVPPLGDVDNYAGWRGSRLRPKSTVTEPYTGWHRTRLRSGVTVSSSPANLDVVLSALPSYEEFCERLFSD